MSEDSLDRLTRLSRQFVEERQWQSFQTPKNLSMAMIVEAGELVEHFQWLTQQESLQPDAGKKQAIADELSDVLVLLLRIADVLDIDMKVAAEDKIRRNGENYPVAEQANGPYRSR